VGFLLNELLHAAIQGLISYADWAQHREGIGAKLLALSIPVTPIALLAWIFMT
jgi:hypothetical protein